MTKTSDELQVVIDDIKQKLEIAKETKLSDFGDCVVKLSLFYFFKIIFVLMILGAIVLLTIYWPLLKSEFSHGIKKIQKPVAVNSVVAHQKCAPYKTKVIMDGHLVIMKGEACMGADHRWHIQSLGSKHISG